MHYNVHIINQYPLLRSKPLVFIGGFLRMQSNFLFHKVCYRFNLGAGIGLTNDKEVCNRFRDLAQIKGNDILPFFVLYGLYDGGKYLAVPSDAC